MGLSAMPLAQARVFVALLLLNTVTLKCCGIYAYENGNYQPQVLCETSNWGTYAWGAETVVGRQRWVLLPRSAGRLIMVGTSRPLLSPFVLGCSNV